VKRRNGVYHSSERTLMDAIVLGSLNIERRIDDASAE
jgi:hypothetical protein